MRFKVTCDYLSEKGEANSSVVIFKGSDFDVSRLTKEAVIGLCLGGRISPDDEEASLYISEGVALSNKKMPSSKKKGGDKSE